MAIDRLTKTECCGCNACGDVCPVNAISFATDNEGFWYPEVDATKCIECGLCEKICPNINIERLKHNDWPEPKEAIAAINLNMVERWDSTSGGAYSVFANKVLSDGGYVSGAVYTEDCHVKNYVTNDPADMPRLRSSKYLESYAEGLYSNIESLLKTGQKVLACGTPCQMAALKAYLRKDYENLIIIDFVCRGVNSPKVYRKYLDSLEARFGSKIISIKAKNKELGWRNLTRKVVFENGQSYYGVLMEDDFRRGYHTNVYCRPSCYSCVFKGFPRMSDITVGDFWGIEKYAPNLDNNIGTSLILINSEKGRSFFESVKDKFEYTALPFNTVLTGNPALQFPLKPAKINRDNFFETLDKEGFDAVVSKYFPPKVRNSEPATLREQIHSVLSLAKNLKNRLRFNLSAYRNFIRINLRKMTIANIRQGKVIYTRSGCVFDLDKTAKINIQAPFDFGAAPVRGMRIASCLRMGKNSELHLLGGERDRYAAKNAPYSLKYGAYIEIINGGKLTFHSGAANVGLTIMCTSEIYIGECVRIGRNVSIRDWNGPHVILTPSYRNHAPIHIGDRVWLCTGCTILPGVTIGEGSVVAANSTVTKDVPPHTLVGGSPAKIIRSDIDWY